MNKLIRRLFFLARVGIALGIFLLWYSIIGVTLGAMRTDVVSADAAVVLGAAAWGSRPSPIFRERINHAIQLYNDGAVEQLIFTGGDGTKSNYTEAEVARQYAIARGVPDSAILLEDQSDSTYSNLANTKVIAANNNIESLIIVSTPFHMRRAMFVANQLDLNAYASPTRTTRWREQNSMRPYLVTREVAAYIGYLVLWPTLEG